MTVIEEAEKYLDTAIEYFENDDFEGAKEYFTKAIKGYSKVIESGVHDKVIYRNRGMAYLGLKDYPKAIKDFSKAIELDENNKDAYDGRGRIYMYIENYPKAIEDFSKVIELDANNKDAYDNRGRAYVCIENYAKAIEDFSKVIELDANNKRGYADRGFVYLHLGNYLKAIEDYTKVIEMDENNKDAYSNRGLAYLRIKDYAKAIEDFTKVIELDENNIDAYDNRGFAYLRLEEYTKAIEDFTKAIELDANKESIYGNRGLAYACIEDYAKAIENFTKMIELDENNKNAYGYRGLAYSCIEDYAKAIEDCTKAIELGANDKLIYRVCGFAYLYKGDYTEAIDDFSQVVKLNKGGNEKNQNTDGIDYALKEIKLSDNILDLIDDILQNNESKVLQGDDSINLIRLVCLCYYLMEEIRINPSDVKEEKIVHYTKANTVQYLLKKDHSAQLRLNNAVYMNDPEEGQILKKVLLGQNNELENLFKDEDVKNYTYLTCFSPYDKRDELPMWIHYGDGGKGVGLVFNKSFFDEADLYKVQYIDVKNFDINKLDQNIWDKITAILNILKKDEIKNNTRTEFKIYVNIILNYVSYLFKDKAYEYESEVRILNYKDYNSQDIKTAVYESGIPRLFIEYDKCISDENCVEVIAGPKANYTEIAAYAKYVGISKVSKSEIKYR